MMDFSEALPFLGKIRALYRSKQSNQILLSGNIWDIYPDTNDKEHYFNLQELLADFLGGKMIIVNFDITNGIKFQNNEEGKLLEDFYVQFGGYKKSQGERRRWFVQRIQESMVYPILALHTLRELCKVIRIYRKNDNEAFAILKRKPLCIIIRDAETILPAGPLERLSESDRQKVTSIREWFSARDFIEAWEMVILISDTISDINQKIKDLPHVYQVSIPYPNLEIRKRYIKQLYHRFKAKIKMKDSQKSLANMTAGLRLTGIKDIFLDAAHRLDEIDRRAVINKVNEVLTKQVGDHIEIIEPVQTLKDVLGNTSLKKKLKELQKRLRSFDPMVVPSGILVSGPNGVGKTFIFTAVASESGRIPVILKNLRSKWFGGTDTIFEKINHVLRALGNVILIVDEADTAFGGRSEQSHETEQRLFGNVLKMMSDPKNRGKIVWILLTARPDKLEPDFKRTGRCGLHLPVFDPTGSDREAFINLILKKANLSLKNFNEEQHNRLNELTKNYSGADFNELRSELLAMKKMEKKTLDAEKILTFIDDWRPTDISEKRRMQTLYAALHCSYRSLLPREFQERTREDILQEIKTLN